jgi:hypothetical protein
MLTGGNAGPTGPIIPKKKFIFLINTVKPLIMTNPKIKTTVILRPHFLAYGISVLPCFTGERKSYLLGKR